MEEIECEGYDLELVPTAAMKDKKTVVTIKGSESGYLEAHRILKEMLNKKGDRFLINGVEIGLSDIPKNKPIIVEVKPKSGLSGRVNLTIFEVNNRGGATIMVSKIRGGDPQHARILGLEVIKYFLDGIIEGWLKEEEILKFKLKTPRIERKKTNKCEKCEKTFPTEQGLKIHVRKTHTETEVKYCDTCRIHLKSEGDFKAHMELEHAEIFSPQAKKRKRNVEEEVLIEESVDIASNENLNSTYGDVLLMRFC